MTAPKDIEVETLIGAFGVSTTLTPDTEPKQRARAFINCFCGASASWFLGDLVPKVDHADECLWMQLLGAKS